MFSHSDLLGHKCEHCVNKRCGFKYPVDRSSVSEREKLAEDCCLWHMLAKACYEWIMTMTQIRPSCLVLTKTGNIKMLESFLEYECLIRPQEQPNIVKALDEKTGVALLPGQTSSNATFDTIRHWKVECEADHPTCRSNNLRPKGILSGIRFLHVGHTSIKLHEEIEPERYACLSHCWGDGKELAKTILQNWTSHVEVGILIERLPRTYQDAVIICKELGIDYLWIDSLCILQGDSKDWENQASRMSDVYENAYLTIAAVGAQDASQGLFSSTSMFRMGLCLPDLPWIHVRRKFRSPMIWTTGYDTITNDGWALYKRAWTFQELSLSPRVLHFGAEEVIWSCREVTACEGEPSCNQSLLDGVLVNMAESHTGLRALWHLIVQAYNFRTLTFEKDKFPAIAAFAKHIQAMNPEKMYVAGLWEDTLLHDLLWVCATNCPISESRYPVKPGSIPSWSWASAKRPVYWMESEKYDWPYNAYTEIIQIIYETQGPPILGSIIEAFLVLRAPIIKLYKDGCKDSETSSKGKKSPSDRVISLQVNCWDHVQGDCDNSNEPPEAFAIPLVTQTLVKLNDATCRALLVTEESPGVYRRAGVGDLSLLEKIPETRPKWGKWNDSRFAKEMSRIERQVIKLV